MAEVEKIRVPGTEFDIILNSTYQIVGKTDGIGAPQGYNRMGMTKVPSYKITTTVHPRFDEDRGIWDLGLDDSSPAFNGLDKEEKTAELRKLQKYISIPLKNIKPKGFLDIIPKPKNEIIRDADYTGLENHSIVLGIDRFFDTSKPEDLFNMYIAIYNGDLAPKQYEHDPRFLQADFCIVNDKQKINKAEDTQYAKDKAVSKLINKWDTDKEFTTTLLKYCGIGVGKGSNEKTVVSFFRKWLNDKDDRGGNNADYFLERYNNFHTDEGKEELYIWDTLQEMFDKKEITVRNGEYFRGSENLGNSLKIYAEKASKDEELKLSILGAVD